MAKSSAAKVEIQSLAGLLNFACTVVRPGRPFLRRLHDATMQVDNKHHHIKVTKAMKKDLRLWLSFLEEYNGKTLFPITDWLSPNTHHCHTDASKLGYGLVYKSHWVYGTFPPEWGRLNIVLLEAYPIMLLFHMFGSMLANKMIILHTDNEALVTILNKQSCKHPGTMVIVREIVLTALKYNVIFKAEHIPGRDNTLSDALSRLQVDAFKSKCKDHDPEPTQVPHNLLPGIFKLD